MNARETSPILLIEDSPSQQIACRTVLLRAGYRVQVAGSAAEGMVAFADLSPDIVLLDLAFPQNDPITLIQDMMRLRPETRVVVMTSNGSVSQAVEAIRAGAHDFLVRPFDEARFLSVVANAGKRARTAARPTGIEEASPPGGLFLGSSETMEGIYAKIRSVAKSMATVFITGESGTGKELCAQAVHDCSARAAGPFIALNCGAIPPDLLESEVFGHMKGSFTGAISDKPGAAAAADGGTLFLDEVCEMDVGLQTKLLRFLQTSTVQPVGSTRPRKVNVRIICATNRDPMEAVRRGQFREDLYYRLYVVPIHMPPLRERAGDVIEIAEAALERFAREEGRQFDGLDDEVADLFLRLPWPGNVRQLLNVIRNVVVLNSGGVVTRGMLPGELVGEGRAEGQGGATPGPLGPTISGLMGKPLAEIEQLVIEATLQRFDGSISKAARSLEVSPSTLYRKLESWAGRQKGPEQG